VSIRKTTRVQTDNASGWFSKKLERSSLSMVLTKLKLAIAALLLITTGSAVLVSQATAQKPTGPVTKIDSLTSSRQADGESSTRDDELDVVLLERAWVDAIPRHDSAVVNRIMADDFEGIDPVGNVFTKEKYLAGLRSGTFTTRAITIDEIKTGIFGETAVVTSRIKVEISPTWGRMTNV
jgi:ketosteroid isomerase-like protein